MRALPSLPSSPGQAAAWRRVAAVDVRAITADSREVRPGYLFAALPGARVDGRPSSPMRWNAGAAAVLAPEGTAWPAGVPPRPLIDDPEPRRRLAADRRRAGRAAAGEWSRSPAPTARPARSSSCARSGRSRADKRRQPGHAGADRARLRRRPRPDHARSGGAGRRRWPSWRAPACSTWRWKPPRTGSTSSGWTGCGWRRPPSPT